MSVLSWSVGLVELVKLASTALPVFVRLATPEKTVKVRRVAWVLRPKCNKRAPFSMTLPLESMGIFSIRQTGKTILLKFAMTGQN